MTWEYRGLQGVTGGYRGLQGVTRGYKELKGVTGGYKWLKVQRIIAVSYTHLTLPTNREV